MTLFAEGTTVQVADIEDKIRKDHLRWSGHILLRMHFSVGVKLW